jgi:hypothetical protein
MSIRQNQAAQNTDSRERSRDNPPRIFWALFGGELAPNGKD